MAEEKSELWNKFYEEEKARLERELLQTVFGTSATSTGSSGGQPRPQSGPVTVKPFVNSIPSSSTATTNPQPSSKRSQPLVEAHLMFGSPAGEPAPTKAAVAPIPVQQSPPSQQLTTRNLASQFTDAGQNDASLSPVDLNSEKLRNISNELVSKWANEYVASSQTVQRVVPAQKQHLLEALMKMRGAAQHEHECSLSTQREALVKQADVELQTLVLQEQVLMERQYKDYVLNKLAQQIYRAHNVPVELSVEKALQEITASNLFMSYAPSTLDTYLEQRNQRIVDDCKRLVDQYVQRKLSTAQTVLLQQHKSQATALKSTESTSSASSSSSKNSLKDRLDQRMQELMAQEKEWIQGRYIATQSVNASQSLRTVEHELWQKAFLAFQKNVTMAGQIALLKQLSPSPST